MIWLLMSFMEFEIDQGDFLTVSDVREQYRCVTDTYTIVPISKLTKLFWV